jgi:type III pantothenate kinase
MTPSLLLLDAGNTRLKWAHVRDARWEARGACTYDDLGELIQTAEAAGPRGQCWIASVAGAARNHLIEQSLREAGVSLHWLESQPEQCGVTSHYSSPKQLGVDRWMSLLAARNRYHSACLVVSAGTAMTVDALTADGQFLGGIIVPGIGLMQQALQQGTALVGQADGLNQTFPDNTADAVRTGAVLAMAGAISLMHERLSSLCAALPRCLLTGGDAGELMPLLQFDAERVPDLVLEGVLVTATAGR